MKALSRLTALAAVLALAAGAPAAAVDPLIYDSTTGYAGTGKHPKKGVTGLVLDGRIQGVSFVCYDYLVLTDDKIKGQVSGIAERISGSKVEKIATYGKNNVQAFDFDQIPPGEDECTGLPTEAPDFNLGIASDCVEVTKTLAAGDIIRWTLKFKKGSKLKGNDSLVQISGSVLPFGAFANASEARENALLTRVTEPSLDLVPRTER